MFIIHVYVFQTRHDLPGEASRDRHADVPGWGGQSVCQPMALQQQGKLRQNTTADEG